MVTFLKFEKDTLTKERLSKMQQYHKLVPVAIDEDMIVFRVTKQ